MGRLKATALCCSSIVMAALLIGEVKGTEPSKSGEKTIRATTPEARKKIFAAYKRALEANDRKDYAALSKELTEFKRLCEPFQMAPFDPEIGAAREHLFFLLMEPHFESFVSDRPSLPPSRLVAGLNRKIGSLDKMERMYLGSIAQLEDSQRTASKKDYRWADACLVRIAQLYLDMVETLAEVPVPAGLALTADDEKIIALRLSKAQPLLDLARVFFSLAIMHENASEALNEWQELAVDQLAKLESMDREEVLKNRDSIFERLMKIRDDARSRFGKMVRGAPESLKPWTHPAEILKGSKRRKKR